MFLDTMDKSQCCGCMACSKICPVSAIEMKQDDRGFFYPDLNMEKCIQCGKCRKVCPMEEKYVGQDADPDIYAVKNKDCEILKESSSGGMFTVLAQWIIKQGGVVYGVAFDETFAVRHMRAASAEMLPGFRGSKYVESDISQVYDSVTVDLKNGQMVLLTGTPCQISALTKYLRLKNVNMDKLYTCDNICHGVPSRKIWEDYLNILKEKYIADDDKITAIHMRSKKVSWKKQMMSITLKKGNIDSIVEKFSFNTFFLSLYGNRSSCFKCKYTSYKRLADFTLGDFWNVENANIQFDVEGGINVLLVNTDKGRRLFEQLKDNIDIQSVSKQECWQPHLEYAAKIPARQEEFWEDYNNAIDKEIVLRKFLTGSMLTRIIRTVTPFLRKTGLYSVAGKVYKLVFVRK